MTFVGMDLVQVQRGADSMSMQAGELTGLLGQLDGVIANLTALWPGPDCDAFQTTWFEHHRPALLAASDELIQRAEWLMRQIEDQAEVSGMTVDQVRGIMLAPCLEPGDTSAQTLLQLSQAAYSDSGDVGDWHRLSDEELLALGIDPSLVRDPASGFSASIFQNSDGQIVVAYCGTTEWFDGIAPGADLVADAQGSVYLSQQSEQAVALALAIRNQVGVDNVVFTGHSLGGRLAAVSSIATGAHAETYNAAGVSPSEMMYAHIAGGGEGPGFFQWIGTHNPVLPDQYDAAILGIDTSNIVNHQAPNDILGGLQSLTNVEDAAGSQQYTGYDTWNPIEAHSLDSLDESI
ncbi:hypothetical protein F0U44_04505 [Nocardioides humilatus]|uniref:DUF2974 domain-containing protein n=1 Tax=Nocardioides humilatus TaxID=2607660 RepID=A0A5B1LLY2_9ACTN|nr:hypothetical protein [Nocardioides humilatus]KAA1421553.1 hypothetical protein F0U44_04505 [Nocardioides humilatus]